MKWLCRLGYHDWLLKKHVYRLDKDFFDGSPSSASCASVLGFASLLPLGIGLALFSATGQAFGGMLMIAALLIWLGLLYSYRKRMIFDGGCKRCGKLCTDYTERENVRKSIDVFFIEYDSKNG